MKANQNMDSIMQVDIKQEKLDYLSDEENKNMYNMNLVVKSELDDKPIFTNQTAYDCCEDTSVTIKDETNVVENGEMQKLHTHLTLKEFTSSEGGNDNLENMKMPIVVHNTNNTNDCSRYFKCPECLFETSSVTDFDVHMKVQHNLSPEVFQCQSCSYNTSNKSNLLRHFQKKHDNTSEIYNCGQCKFKTTYQPELKRHYQWKHDENSVSYICEHCHYVTKRKHCLNRHIKMKHCDKTITLRCTYCEYTTKWSQCLRRHISAMHFGKQYQNTQDGLEPLYEENTTRGSISQDNLHGNEQIDCTLKPKLEIGEDDSDPQLDAGLNEHTTLINSKNLGVGIANNNLNTDNLVFSNCSFPLPVLITTSNNPSSMILVNSLNVVQNPNNANKPYAHYSPKKIIRIVPFKSTSRDGDDVKRVNSTVITECGNSQQFCCEFCDYKTGSKSYLSRHQRKDHPEAIRATLRCEFCSYKSNCRSEMTRHFKLKHDQTSAVFECAFCPFKTKYKPEFNRHYKLKHDESSHSFVCGFCRYCTKRKHSLIRHIKMKHDEGTETLKCHDCNYTTKWKQSLKTHVKLKHASSSQFTVQHIKHEIKME